MFLRDEIHSRNLIEFLVHLICEFIQLALNLVHCTASIAVYNLKTEVIITVVGDLKFRLYLQIQL